MAIFNPTPNPTQDPNWLSQSKEYDKPKALPADNTMGTLFANLGELTGQAVTVTDANLNRNAKNLLFEKIDAIRDAHGANLTPDEVPAIAGTGARGARYDRADAAGLEDFAAGAGDEVPAGAKSKLDGLQRLAQAREAGKLSDSHYYSALETAVREVRARYPGYRDQIDSMVSGITGVTPANALRSSLLRDMNARAAAASAGDKAGEAWYARDQEYFGILFPNQIVDGKFVPGITKAQAIARRAELEPMIGTFKARDYDLKYQGASIELNAKTEAAKNTQSNIVYANHANEVVSTFLTGVSNVEGLNFKEIEQRTKALAAQGEKASPEAVQKAAQDYAMIEQGLLTKMDQRLRAPLAPGSANSLATYMKPAEIEAVNQAALAQVRVVKNLLGVKEFGTAAAAANLLKHQGDVDMRSLMGPLPSLRLAKALENFPPEIRQILLTNSGVLPGLAAAMNTVSWLKVADPALSKVPPPITDSAKALGGIDGKPVSLKEHKVLLDNHRALMEHSDPVVASRAVQSVFGDPRFLADLNGADTTNSDRMNMYMKLGNPEFTKKMLKLRDTHPEAWIQYSQAMERTFGVVAKQGIDDLQQALSYRNYEVIYDPRTMQWSAKTKSDVPAPPTAGGGGLSGKYQYPVGSDPAAFYVSKVNQAMTVIKPILEKQYSERAGAQMLQILKDNGLDPGAEKKGPIIEELLKKIPEWSQPELLDPRLPGKRSDSGAMTEVSAQSKQQVSSQMRSWDALMPLLGQIGAKISDASWDRFVKEASIAKLDDRRGDPDPEFTQILREKSNWDDLTDSQKDLVKRTAISELAGKMNTELGFYDQDKNPDKEFSPTLLKRLPPELRGLAKEAGLDDLINMMKARNPSVRGEPTNP